MTYRLTKCPGCGKTNSVNGVNVHTPSRAALDRRPSPAPTGPAQRERSDAAPHAEGQKGTDQNSLGL